jgi:hypothetical protein
VGAGPPICSATKGDIDRAVVDSVAELFALRTQTVQICLALRSRRDERL